MKDVVIVGHSGFAEEIKWLLDRINKQMPTWNFLGYVDQEIDDDVIGDDEYIVNYKKELSVVIAIGEGAVRKKLYEKYTVNKNINFPNIIDPSVQYSDDISLGVGNIICAGTIATVKVEFGNFNIVNLDCTVGHEAKLVNYVTLNPSVNVSGNVKIGSCSMVGTGGQIIQGIEIGENVTLGAGAVAVNNIGPNSVAVGVPAKVIKNKLE